MSYCAMSTGAPKPSLALRHFCTHVVIMNPVNLHWSLHRRPIFVAKACLHFDIAGGLGHLKHQEAFCASLRNLHTDIVLLSITAKLAQDLHTLLYCLRLLAHVLLLCLT